MCFAPRCGVPQNRVVHTSSDSTCLHSPARNNDGRNDNKEGEGRQQGRNKADRQNKNGGRTYFEVEAQVRGFFEKNRREAVTLFVYRFVVDGGCK